MTRRTERDPIYRGRRFSSETIELCVRWYITYRLSYRNLAAMMAERDVIVSHTTIMRWVLRYVPDTSADGLASLNRRVHHGVWMKRL
jgi:transposase-like protein